MLLRVGCEGFLKRKAHSRIKIQTRVHPEECFCFKPGRKNAEGVKPGHNVLDAVTFVSTSCLF